MTRSGIDNPDILYQQFVGSEADIARLANPLKQLLNPTVDIDRAHD